MEDDAGKNVAEGRWWKEGGGRKVTEGRKENEFSNKYPYSKNKVSNNGEYSKNKVSYNYH